MIVNRYLENEVENVAFKVCDAAPIPTIADALNARLSCRKERASSGPVAWSVGSRNVGISSPRLCACLVQFEQTLAYGVRSSLGTAPVYR
jgi:hypothetical protein